jgi:hypothetical protein
MESNMESFLDKIGDVIQDLEDARSKCLALGLDTLALRLHESVNTMLDLQEATEKVKVPSATTYNNSGEIMALIAKQLMERTNEQS